MFFHVRRHLKGHFGNIGLDLNQHFAAFCLCGLPLHDPRHDSKQHSHLSVARSLAHVERWGPISRFGQPANRPNRPPTAKEREAGEERGMLSGGGAGRTEEERPENAHERTMR